MKCKLRRLWWRIVGTLLFPIRIEDQVKAYLIKDGRVIRTLTGYRIHNKWDEISGLDHIALCLVNGAASGALEVVEMELGSECSDTSFTSISGTTVSTSNSHPGTAKAKFTGEWGASGAINGICQVALRMVPYSGSGTTRSAIYNFGTSFDKPDGVSLKIEWTTTLSS
ncbi:MAG: hypothetical protein DRJ47_09365 [Thermoprotei archaeon]|nr:MAG: hypothetical protein DRJ47_09365 [Thermoprotei archaeon]